MAGEKFVDREREGSSLHKESQTKEDGRYIIFYEFENQKLENEEDSDSESGERESGERESEQR